MKTLWTISRAIFATLIFLVIACAPTTYERQSASRGQLDGASKDINSNAIVFPKSVSPADALTRIDLITQKLSKAAEQVCFEVGEDDCWWVLRYSDDPALNAAAINDGTIVIQRGVIEYAQSDDEIAMVIAHEFGHHIANHLEETAFRMGISTLVMAGAYAGIAASGASANPYYESNIYNATIAGSQLGGKVGRVIFSPQQELEADYLSAIILSRSGYDTRKARAIIVTLSQLGSSPSAGFWSTHPGGVERLALWDQLSMQLKAKPDLKPQRQ